MTMKRFTLWFLLPALLALLPGCGEDFPDAAYIESFRILGVRSEPLEAAPGEQITFDALVVNSDATPYDGPLAWAIAYGTQSQLTDSAQFDPSSAYLQTSPDEPFVWTVPARAELEKQFGPLGKNGILLAVVVGAFPGGDLDKEPRLAYKMFAVSDRAERMTNPAITGVKVMQGGDEIAPDSDGEFSVDNGKVDVRIETDQPDEDYLTFHWFTVYEDFEHKFRHQETIDTDDRDLTPVYCVLRKEWFFEQDDGGVTRLIGMDWREVVLHH